MATIKAYTDIEQSKRLSEILPIESADMCFNDNEPCWSLAALLNILPVGTETHKQIYDSIECYYVEVYNNRKYFCTDRYVDLLDACVKMIFALKQRNLL